MATLSNGFVRLIALSRDSELICRGCKRRGRCLTCLSCSYAVCGGCSVFHFCLPSYTANDFEDSPQGSPRVSRESSCDSHRGGHTQDSAFLIDDVVLYERFGVQLWSEREFQVYPHADLWVHASPVPELDSFVIDDGLTTHAFGQAASDYRQLAQLLAWDFPSGLAVVHISRQKCIVFANGSSTHIVCGLRTALLWLRRMNGLGLAVEKYSRGPRLRFQLVEALWMPRQTTRDAVTRKIVARALRLWNSHCPGSLGN